MNGIEASLSKARLELLDKRKELREIVFKHYADLIGIVDHACTVEKHIDSQQMHYSKLISYGRTLHGVANSPRETSNVTIPQSDELSPLSEHDNSEFIENVLSLNRRALNEVRCMRFDSASRVLTEELPALRSQWSTFTPHEHVSLTSLCRGEFESFSSLPNRVVSSCWNLVQSVSFRSVEALSSCVQLISALSPHSPSAEFWSRRAKRLHSTKVLSEKFFEFDLSLITASQLGLPYDLDFVHTFGTPDGMLVQEFCSKFANSGNEKMLPELVTIRSTLTALRQGKLLASSSPMEDVLESLSVKVREILVMWTQRKIATLNFHESNIVMSLDEFLSTARHDLLQFPVWPDVEFVEQILREECGKWIVKAALESDRSKDTGVHASALIRAKHLETYFGAEGLRRITELQRDSFDLFFDELVIDLSQKHSFGFDTTSEGKIFNFGVANDLPVPSHLSPSHLLTLIETATAIMALPAECHSVATESAKSALARFFCSYFSSHVTSIQSLFDLAVAVLLTSSISDDAPDHEYLSTTVYETAQEKILKDSVDLALYAEVLRKSAFLAATTNSILFHPFLLRNPMVAHLTGLGWASVETEVKAGVITDSLCRNGEGGEQKRCTILPIAKTVANKAGTSRASPARAVSQSGSSSTSKNVFNASAVTSFFNQVGKITLGTKP